jgi:hypothetical protein
MSTLFSSLGSSERNLLQAITAFLKATLKARGGFFALVRQHFMAVAPLSRWQ